MLMPEDLLFYQTIDLPGHETIHGSWDHRDTADVYLGGVEFKNKKILDVGPANGFFSFEMEKRGAYSVTALDLGVNTPWDVVPHTYQQDSLTVINMAENVAKVEAAFWYSHKLLESKVNLVYGSVYDTPKLVEIVDIGLMSNVLQHFRDPFLAIQRVASVCSQTLIITETLWVEESECAGGANMRLIASSESPETNHSWWQVSPGLCIEILKLVGFPYIKLETHFQKFNYSSADIQGRMVKHFTLVANRPKHFSTDELKALEITYSKDFYERENDSVYSWHWSSGGAGEVFIHFDGAEAIDASLNFGLSTVDPRATFDVRLNNELIWSKGAINGICPINIGRIKLLPGTNVLKFSIKGDVFNRLTANGRTLGFRLVDFNVCHPGWH